MKLERGQRPARYLSRHCFSGPRPHISLLSSLPAINYIDTLLYLLCLLILTLHPLVQSMKTTAAQQAGTCAEFELEHGVVPQSPLKAFRSSETQVKHKIDYKHAVSILIERRFLEASLLNVVCHETYLSPHQVWRKKIHTRCAGSGCVSLATADLTLIKESPSYPTKVIDEIKYKK